MSTLASRIAWTLLCAGMLGCTGEPEPSRIEFVAPSAAPAPAPGAAPAAGPADAGETAPASADTAQTPEAPAVPEADAEPEQFVVYFGAFRDYLAASRYSESLRSAGLLQLNIKRARGGGSELILTDPMDRADADALADSLGGRVLSADSVEGMTEKPGSLLQ